jgi:hypothetical protein
LLMAYREMWGLWVRNMFFPRSRWGVMKLYWCYRPRSPQNIVLDVLRSFPIFASQGLRLEKGDPKHNPWLAKMIQNMKIKKNIIQYFVANEVDNTNKVSSLLIWIGGKTYSLLRDLTFPDKPSTKTYDQLTQLLNNICRPSPLLLQRDIVFINVTKTSTWHT